MCYSKFYVIVFIRCIYEISLETVYREKKQTITTERLFIEVPGSPDEPILWLMEQKENNVVIHWSEPRGKYALKIDYLEWLTKPTRQNSKFFQKLDFQRKIYYAAAKFILLVVKICFIWQLKLIKLIPPM